MTVHPNQGILVLSVDVRGDDRTTLSAALEVLDRMSGLDLPATWSTIDADFASRIASRLVPNETAVVLPQAPASRSEFSRQLALALAGLKTTDKPVTSLVMDGPLAHADLIAERGIAAIRTTPTVAAGLFSLRPAAPVAQAPELVKGGLWSFPVTCVLGAKSGRRWLAGRSTRSVPSVIGSVAAEGGFAHLLITLESSGAASAARSVSPVLALVRALVEQGLKVETVQAASRRLAAGRVRPGARGSILRAA